MPKIIIHSAEGVFDLPARRKITEALVDLALECERLPQSPFVRSTVWTYFNEYTPDSVFMSDKPAHLDCVSMQIYTIEGGLDAQSKLTFIEKATETLARYCAASQARVPVYIVIHEVPETNWGIFGKHGDLAALRASEINAPAL
jgi:phenylpyruvate tautomerase PptA (4-oxalocrotonate tautomerase family)